MGLVIVVHGFSHSDLWGLYIGASVVFTVDLGGLGHCENAWDVGLGGFTDCQVASGSRWLRPLSGWI